MQRVELRHYRYYEIHQRKQTAELAQQERGLEMKSRMAAEETKCCPQMGFYLLKCWSATQIFASSPGNMAG